MKRTRPPTYKNYTPGERSYLAHSSIFDSTTYRGDEYERVLRSGGVPNVRQSLYNGWSNQPKVVTFPTEYAERAKAILSNLPEFRRGMIMHVKDWR